MPFYQQSEQMQRQGKELLNRIQLQFPALKLDQLALTWIVYDDPVPVNTGGAIAPDSFWQLPLAGYSHRGNSRIYPASVVKLFYLVAAEEWLQQGMLQPSAELDRALRDMIVDSSNDATSLIVDMLTGTTSGPELPPEPFETWKRQRQIVNRYFRSLGWPEMETCNLCQKAWAEGPYGREHAFYGPNFENRNLLTTDATARLLHAIAGGVAVSASASQRMMNLLARSLDPTVLAADPENQVTGFLGGGLPEGSRLWSKAGWMSRVRHDAAYIEAPDRSPILLITFTEGSEHANQESILPFIVKQVLDLTPKK
jgi:beta-lactamase class A